MGKKWVGKARFHTSFWILGIYPIWEFVYVQRGDRKTIKQYMIPGEMVNIDSFNRSWRTMN